LPGDMNAKVLTLAQVQLYENKLDCSIILGF